MCANDESGSRFISPTPMFRSTRTTWNELCEWCPWDARTGTSAGPSSVPNMFASSKLLIGTCRLHGVDPDTYLVDVLQRISEHPASRVIELTPRLWKQFFAANPMRSDIGDIF